MQRHSRSTFLTILGSGAIGLALPTRAGSQVAAPAGRPGFRHDLERARSIVSAAHRNFDAVRELVREQPALAKASWDWGFGDWESALGAAAHTGAREIAEYLIAHGARPTIFSSAMMGEVDVVRAAIRAQPDLATLDGPHGIALLNHARAGGADASGVVDYLLDEAGVEDEPFGVEATPELHERYGGSYRDPAADDVQMTVDASRRFLMIGAGATASSRVLEVEEHTFHPTGAPSVRLRFDVENGRASRVTVVDGGDMWRLERR